MGNVMTGADTTSGAAGADTVGADNATVSGREPRCRRVDNAFDANGNLKVRGSSAR